MLRQWAAPSSCRDLMDRQSETFAYLRRYSNPDASLCVRADAAVEGALATTGTGKARAARSRQNIHVLLRRFQTYLTSVGVPRWPVCPIRIAVFLASHLDAGSPVLKRTLASYRSDLQGVMNGMAHVWRGTAFESAFAGVDLLRDVVNCGRVPPRQAKKRGRSPVESSPENEVPPVCVCRQPESNDMIHCDEPSCATGWYHYECINEDVSDESTWVCARCRYTNISPSPSTLGPPTPLLFSPSVECSPFSSPSGLALSFHSPVSPPSVIVKPISMPTLPRAPSTPGLDALASLCASAARVPTDLRRYSISSGSSATFSEGPLTPDHLPWSLPSRPSRIWEESAAPSPKKRRAYFYA